MKLYCCGLLSPFPDPLDCIYLVTPSSVLGSRPVHDATIRIEVIIFSIATYLNLSSQARVMTLSAVLPGNHGIPGVIKHARSILLFCLLIGKNFERVISIISRILYI